MGLADVQYENGFTKVAHKILEETMKLKLSPTQFKIILAVWRYTYGFNRKDHEMSLTFLAEAIRAHKQGVKKDLDKLIEMKILIVTEESTFSKSRKIAFNKNYDSWINLQSVKQHTVSQIADSTVSQTTDSPVSQIAYQEIYSLNKYLNIKDTEEDDLLKRILEILEKSEILGEKGITEFLRDDITDIIEKFNFDSPEEMIVEAIKDSARGNGKTWKYVYKKLVAWKKQGIKNLSDLENLQDEELTNPKKQNRKGYGRAPVRKEHIPDHMDEPYTPKQVDPGEEEAKKRAIEEKLKQFRK
jgi:phage replication O-like protein O